MSLPFGTFLDSTMACIAITYVAIPTSFQRYRTGSCSPLLQIQKQRIQNIATVNHLIGLKLQLILLSLLVWECPLKSDTSAVVKESPPVFLYRSIFYERYLSTTLIFTWLPVPLTGRVGIALSLGQFSDTPSPRSFLYLVSSLERRD